MAAGVGSVRRDSRPKGFVSAMALLFTLDPVQPVKAAPTARELATTADGRNLIEFTETGLLTMSRPSADDKR